MFLIECHLLNYWMTIKVAKLILIASNNYYHPKSSAGKARGDKSSVKRDELHM